MEDKKLYSTNYDVAVHWCNNHYIRCNNIIEYDEELYDNFPELDEDREIFQYFISDCTEGDVEYLTETFPGLLFAYSPKLALYILLVDHYGTSWDYVYWETTNKIAECELGKHKEDLI